MSKQPYVVFATGNKNKVKEMAKIVEPTGVRMISLAEFPDAIDVAEDGATFGQNARKKACEQAKHLREWTLAEDSGICVDYLDGAPGVYSARFACVNRCDDKRNNQLLLEKLEGVPFDQRTARYTCHMVLANSEGEVVFEAEEICPGHILFQELGSGGFGYDPMFQPLGYETTFGMLPAEVKAQISHRAKATKILVPYLVDLVKDKRLPLKQFTRSTSSQK
jgi:XTP/dITP diphosphohydrolase